MVFLFIFGQENNVCKLKKPRLVGGGVCVSLFVGHVRTAFPSRLLLRWAKELCLMIIIMVDSYRQARRSGQEIDTPTSVPPLPPLVP